MRIELTLLSSHWSCSMSSSLIWQFRRKPLMLTLPKLQRAPWTGNKEGSMGLMVLRIMSWLRPMYCIPRWTAHLCFLCQVRDAPKESDAVYLFIKIPQPKLLSKTRRTPSAHHRNHLLKLGFLRICIPPHLKHHRTEMWDSSKVLIFPHPFVRLSCNP